MIFQKVVLITLCLFSTTVCWAGQGGNGGNWTEADLKHFLTRLVSYIGSPEGQTLFPEVVAYDKANPIDTFERVLTELNPSLVNHSVYDRDNNERDCVSGIDKGIRFFQCNVNSLPPKPDDKASSSEKSGYYGSMYRLVLHEGFVQVGLEKPLLKEVPSEYNLSSRLSVHLENFPEWVPGAPVASNGPYVSIAYRIVADGNVRSGSGTGRTPKLAEYYAKVGCGSLDCHATKATKSCVALIFPMVSSRYPADHACTAGDMNSDNLKFDLVASVAEDISADGALDHAVRNLKKTVQHDGYIYSTTAEGYASGYDGGCEVYKLWKCPGDETATYDDGERNRIGKLEREDQQRWAQEREREAAIAASGLARKLIDQVPSAIADSRARTICTAEPENCR